MDVLKKIYPNAFKANTGKDLLIAIIIYIVIDVICGIVIGLLSKIPLIGFIFSLLGAVIGLYAFLGIVLSVLVFLKVIKN